MKDETWSVDERKRLMIGTVKQFSQISVRRSIRNKEEITLHNVIHHHFIRP